MWFLVLLLVAASQSWIKDWESDLHKLKSPRISMCATRGALILEEAAQHRGPRLGSTRILEAHARLMKEEILRLCK